jgi:hypothetical protein
MGSMDRHCFAHSVTPVFRYNLSSRLDCIDHLLKAIHSMDTALIRQEIFISLPDYFREARCTMIQASTSCRT